MHRATHILLPDHGPDAAAAAGLLGVPHAARVARTLLSPASPSADYDAGCGVSWRRVPPPHPPSRGVSGMAHIHGQLVKHLVGSKLIRPIDRSNHNTTKK